MMLKPCPCGDTPTCLYIADDPNQGYKWAECYGDCCNEWRIEFRANYLKADSEECMALAVAAWNAATRGKT